MKNTFEGIYFITDGALCGARGVLETVRQAVQAGVCAVQLRDKAATARELLEQARAILEITRHAEIPLIINDRVDVALAVGAEGVHVGQNDIPFLLAREILGPDAIIGLTMDSIEHIKQANELEPNYVSIGPVFPTNTKKDHSPIWGPAGFQEACTLTRHPVVAIGGINSTNVSEVYRAGARCIAAVSAICTAEDINQAIRELKCGAYDN